MLATMELGAVGGKTRKEATNRVAQKLARDLGIRNLERWSVIGRRAYERIAPIVAAATPANWSADAKRSMRKLLRAKGGELEADYARLLGQHGVFLAELRKACRQAEKTQA